MSQRRIAAAFVVLSSLLLAGCATITRGTSEALVIETDPVGADVAMSNGLACKTPCSVTVSRKESFVVTIRREGYETVTANITSQVAGAGAVGMAGNVVVGGIIGVGVDAVTGATKELKPNPVVVKMIPLGGAGRAGV